MAERTGVLVVGGGQAGLIAGFYLRRRGLPFVILDGRARVGDSWRGDGTRSSFHRRPLQRAAGSAVPR